MPTISRDDSVGEPSINVTMMSEPLPTDVKEVGAAGSIRSRHTNGADHHVAARTDVRILVRDEEVGR